MKEGSDEEQPEEESVHDMSHESPLIDNILILVLGIVLRYEDLQVFRDLVIRHTAGGGVRVHVE